MGNRISQKIEWLGYSLIVTLLSTGTMAVILSLNCCHLLTSELLLLPPQQSQPMHLSGAAADKGAYCTFSLGAEKSVYLFETDVCLSPDLKQGSVECDLLPN
jgi:hypothetical protein